MGEKCTLVAAAKIRDHETGLVSGSFSWSQSRQIFRETHETKANITFTTFPPFFFKMGTEIIDFLFFIYVDMASDTKIAFL